MAVVRAIALGVAASLLLSGCAAVRFTEDPVEKLLLAQQPEQALSVLEQRQVSDRNRGLQLLDKGMLLRMQGQFESSNTTLEEAKGIAEQLDAISLREQAAASSINDIMRSYSPPPFELVMLHCVKILNYLELGKLDDARVEALQLDVLLKDKMPDKEVPFARYLAGLVFEARNEYDDALISYRKSYEAYKANGFTVPLALQLDLLRLTQYLKLTDENKKLQEEFSLTEWPTQKQVKEQGELILIIFNGLVPRKHETSLNVQDPMSGKLYRIAIPFYEEREPAAHGAQLAVGTTTANTELSDQLDRHAKAALDAEMPKIIARTIARVAVKSKTVDELGKNNALVGMVANIAGFVSEQADTRAWYTLPQQILIGRMRLAPGKQDLTVTLEGTSGEHTWHDIEIAAGKKRFVSWHWPASRSLIRRASQ
ncbi:MAG: hypothetical protein HY272_03535 [Gammaproteobacteria bacterium]|nr:hypothetical protein [Gammaproteobacteria bacterium]